ncbi:MAG TPA: (2Fe-2S)-binding protein [Elusimicrobia bacterium]|nr:MAG: (2Fe-2S)-binding protein [Elusimicrobia bacterium GWF2_62_30]HBA60397.1 (2Fe-2S)-binding protein [Elusimicrobiota bacterium]
MKPHLIQFTLNGEKVSLTVEPSDVLLDVLRGRLGIKSPKVGCDRGDCGTCTVLMDGKTVRSCLALAVEAHGADIVTLEGANSRKWTQKLQKKFHEKNAFQCGFCAPGVILSATELLEKDPNPTAHEIKEAIAGNLCRCTGYEPIVEAIEETVKGK